jgi:hypothetical protein
MWHAVTPVSSGYDPIVYEGAETARIVILNAGPGTVLARAWADMTSDKVAPIELELRPGAQRVLSGLLVRVKLKDPKDGGSKFAAVSWRVCGGY